jgi:DNA polymerase I
MHTETASYLKVFKRNTDGTSSIENVYNFKPYFYVDEDFKIEGWPGVLKTEKGYLSIEKTPVKKVTISSTKDLKNFRNNIEERGAKHWEIDVPYNNRYLIDYTEEIEKAPLKTCFFDIETASLDENNNVFPDIENPQHVVCSIVATIGDKTETWLLGKCSLENIRFFDTETELLKDFFSWIKTESPDLISAWNLDGFDLPYLINRARAIGVDYRWISKIGKVKERNFLDKTIYNPIGTITFDLLTAYKLWRKYGNFPLLESYSLDFVAKSVLKEEKLKHGKTVTWLWHNDKEALIEYNRIDVELLVKINDRCKIVGFFDEIRRKSRIQILDVYKTTAIIDGYLLTRLKKRVILPSAKKATEDKFGGATVLEPTPGVFEYVLGLDAASLYPSIIKTFNISYETVGGTDIILPIEGHIGFSKTPGIIPMFLDELKEERKLAKLKLADASTEAEKEYWHQKQYGIKIISNSMFGFLGFPGSRLYKKEVASSVTGMGRYLLLEIKNWIEDSGRKVLYGDTDGLYVLATKKDRFEVVEEGLALNTFINYKLNELCRSIAKENYIVMEFEKVLERVIYTDAKKRYAYKLLWEARAGKSIEEGFIVDSDVHIQGYGSKRSDNSILSKKTQKEVINMILDGKPRSEVMSYLRSIYKDMIGRKYTDEEIGIPKGITKPLEQYWPPSSHIKGAMFSNQHFNTSFGKGTKPKIVYIKSYRGIVPEITIKGKVYKLESIAYDTEIPEGFIVDWKKMSEKTFTQKLEKLFSAIKWELEPLDNQTLWSY